MTVGELMARLEGCLTGGVSPSVEVKVRYALPLPVEGVNFENGIVFLECSIANNDGWAA